MSDDNIPVSGTMRPAIPSRATGENKPIVPAGAGLEAALSLQAPRVYPVPSDEYIEATYGKAKKMRKVPKARHVSESAIEKRADRSAAIRSGMRKAKKVNKHKSKVVRAVTKNPNRPLELKSQMQALLEGFRSLKGLEHEAFTNCVLAMQDLSKPGRRHVLDALMKVYAS